MRPVAIPCPKCDAKFLTKSAGKKPMFLCANKECGYKQEILEEDAEGVAGAEGAEPESAETDAAPASTRGDDGGQAPHTPGPAAASTKRPKSKAPPRAGRTAE